jgi:Ca2+-binding EF-hand superfamily protein
MHFWRLLDYAAIQLGKQHASDSLCTTSEQMLMRKRIREAGKDLRDVFRDMDRDGSGAVSYDELKQLLRCVVCT